MFFIDCMLADLIKKGAETAVLLIIKHLYLSFLFASYSQRTAPAHSLNVAKSQRGYACSFPFRITCLFLFCTKHAKIDTESYLFFTLK